MDTQTAVALAQEAASLNIGYTLFALLLIVAVASFILGIGERVLGLNLKGVVDAVEARAVAGDVWPAVVSFFVVPACLLGLVLYIGLR